jgi:isopentenyldiphosphate isomerase
MEEWLDIVDSDDVVIGKDTRRKIHEHGHFHRAAHIVLFRPNGQVFVQLRSMLKDSGAGLWDTSAAGHLDSGETYRQCAIRELEEELGVCLPAEAFQWIDKLPPEARNGYEFTAIFAACTDQVLKLQADEIDDGRWLTPEALDGWIQSDRSIFTDVFLMIWPIVRSYQSG